MTNPPEADKCRMKKKDFVHLKIDGAQRSLNLAFFIRHSKFLNWVQSGKFKALGFFKTAHHVHGMYGLAGSALHEVVDG
jgi:hypothetical protein